MGSPVDDALDRIVAREQRQNVLTGHAQFLEDIATVREALERQREERDRLASSGGAYMERALAAEAEVRQLREERDAALDLESGTQDALDDWRRTGIEQRERAEAAEAEVRRLTEGLRQRMADAKEQVRREYYDDGGITFSGTPLSQVVEEAIDSFIDALLSASPSDGGGAK